MYLKEDGIDAEYQLTITSLENGSNYVVELLGELNKIIK